MDAKWIRRAKNTIDNRTKVESKELLFSEIKNIQESIQKIMINMKILRLKQLMMEKNQRNQKLRMLKKKEEKMNKFQFMTQQKIHQLKLFMLNQIMMMERK